MNDQFPGPVINVTEGDTVIIKVTNTVHRDSISLHCHGLSMRGFPEMDGAAGFTQVRNILSLMSLASFSNARNVSNFVASYPSVAIV